MSQALGGCQGLAQSAMDAGEVLGSTPYVMLLQTGPGCNFGMKLRARLSEKSPRILKRLSQS